MSSSHSSAISWSHSADHSAARPNPGTVMSVMAAWCARYARRMRFTSDARTASAMAPRSVFVGGSAPGHRSEDEPSYTSDFRGRYCALSALRITFCASVPGFARMCANASTARACTNGHRTGSAGGLVFLAIAGVSSSGASRCASSSMSGRSISRCGAPTTSGTWFGSVARIRDGPARYDRTRRCGRGRGTRAIAAVARSGAEAAMWFVLRAPKRVTTNDLSESINPSPAHVVIWRRNLNHSRRRLRACRARRGAWPGWSGASRRPTCRPQSWRRTTSERSSAITRATRGRWRCR